MSFTVHFIHKKSKVLEWLYILLFRIELLIAAPFIYFAIFSEVLVYLGRTWIKWLSEKLDIDFTL